MTRYIPSVKYLRLLLIIPILVLLLTTVGCEDFFGGTQTTTEEPVQEQEEPSTIIINTGERAILAVHEHLFNLAESYEAKQYLADFYTADESWAAESDLFQDGTIVWYVTAMRTNMAVRGSITEWQEAVWLVFRDGVVIPSNQARANSLRIEATLQELSTPAISE
jgi:hypothetical protein